MGGLVSRQWSKYLIKNGRSDELESYDLGVRFMIKFSYYPEEMIGVMKILKNAAGPNRMPEFQSIHPDPENRNKKFKNL